MSLALLCARVSHDTLRRVLYQKVPWSRRLWESFAQGLVQKGGYLVIDDTSWERFTRVAEAVSWVWSSSVGKPVWGMQVVLLLWTDGKWKVPVGIRLWRKGGPSKVELAIGLFRQARRRGLQPAYVLGDSWYAAAQILNLLDGWGWQYVMRLKSNRKFGEQSLRTTWPHRYGHAQGELRGVDTSSLGGQRRPPLLGNERSDPHRVKSKRITPTANRSKRRSVCSSKSLAGAAVRVKNNKPNGRIYT